MRTIYSGARNFAIEKHANQKYGDKPYIYHLDKVRSVCDEFDLNLPTTIAAYLHDVLEDTDTTYEELVENFGERVAGIVYGVTDEEGATRKERKEKTYPKIASNYDSTLLKLADRISNIRESIKDGRQDLVEMYRSEHREFLKHLFCSDAQTNEMAMWIELENLLETLK